MSPTDDDRVTGAMRPDRDSPADASVDRTERDYRGDEGTVRMEPEAVWGSFPPPAETLRDLPSEVLPPSSRASVPDPAQSASKRATSWPGWVLPYLIACITLVLTGLFVLWTQARILGHF